MSDLFDLSGKVAVVTGGSRGMGKEMVLAFARHGADVVIASRKLDSCEELAAEVESTTGQRALPVACHVGDWDQCDQLVDRGRFAANVKLAVRLRVGRVSDVDEANLVEFAVEGRLVRERRAAVAGDRHVVVDRVGQGVDW